MPAMTLDDAVFPNYKNLLGADDTLSQLIKAATPLPALGISESMAKMLKNSQLAAMTLPVWANLIGSSPWQESLKNARFPEQTFSNELRSLAALARPFADAGAALAAQHAATITGLSGFSKVLVEAVRTPDFIREAALAQNWQKHLLTDWADVARQPFVPTWTTQLESIGKLMAEAQRHVSTAWSNEEEADEGEQETDLAGALLDLNHRFEEFTITSAADVRTLRSEIQTFYVSTVAGMQHDVQELVKAGKSPMARFILAATIYGAFISLITLPNLIDWYIGKLGHTVPTQEQVVTKQDLVQFKAELIDSVKQIAAEQGRLRVVARAVRVRSKPNTKSAVLGVLTEGQEVSQLDSDGKYVYVSFQDVDALPVHGWVLKKYLERAHNGR